jgi:hypothetical protein
MGSNARKDEDFAGNLLRYHLESGHEHQQQANSLHTRDYIEVAQESICYHRRCLCQQK